VAPGRGLHTEGMSDEVVQAAKAAAELEPAVEAIAEATGSMEPAREGAGWLADLIRYKLLPHQARLLMRAAERVKETGLPAHAVLPSVAGPPTHGLLFPRVPPHSQC
jgi:hypothetical protein